MIYSIKRYLIFQGRVSQHQKLDRDSEMKFIAQIYIINVWLTKQKQWTVSLCCWRVIFSPYLSGMLSHLLQRLQTEGQTQICNSFDDIVLKMVYRHISDYYRNEEIRCYINLWEEQLTEVFVGVNLFYFGSLHFHRFHYCVLHSEHEVKPRCYNGDLKSSSGLLLLA